MRICIVTREYPPVTPRSGGIGHLYSALAPELARQGHEVDVVTMAESEPRVRRENGVTLRISRPISPRLARIEDLIWGRTASRIVRDAGGFDVVFAAEWGGDAWWYARKKDEGRLVTNLVTSLAQILEIEGEHTTRLPTKQRMMLRLERYQSEHSDALVGCTHQVLEWSRRLWGIDGIPSTVLPCMIDVPGVRRMSQGDPPAAMPKDAPVVLFAGRLEVRKGAHVLGRAMSEVWHRVPEAQLVMVGGDEDGPAGWSKMSAYLRDAARQHPSNLHLIDHQPVEGLYAAMAAADVVALPSLWENFSLTSLAAMAIGCPMILTSGGGYSEFFQAGVDCLMVPPDDADSLAASVGLMLESPELRRRLGASARRHAEEYDVPVVTRRYADFFSSVTAQSPSTSNASRRAATTSS